MPAKRCRNLLRKSWPSGAIAQGEGRLSDAVTAFRRSFALPIPGSVRGRTCRACAVAKLARAYDAIGETDSAVAVYERFLQQPEVDYVNAMGQFTAPTHERLFELYLARGDRAAAARHGAAFLKLWAHADPALQPRVAAMRRLAALAPDRPR